MSARTLAEAREHFGVREWGQRAPAAVRILRRVQENANGCWIFSPTPANGYGAVRVRQQGGGYTKRTTHSALFQIMVADIPEGMQIDHLCRVTSCCNPAHLEAVSPRENTRRSLGPSGLNAAKTHCHKGHPFDEVNTRYTTPHRRLCRACKREEAKARYDAGLRPTIQDHQHGSYTGYGYGCRCDDCRAALARYRAKRRAK